MNNECDEDLAPLNEGLLQRLNLKVKVQSCNHNQ